MVGYVSQIIRLIRMREMQNIVSMFAVSVCLSASLSVRLSVNFVSLYKNDWTDQDAVWGEHLWGPRNVVLDEYVDRLSGVARKSFRGEQIQRG